MKTFFSFLLCMLLVAFTKAQMQPVKTGYAPVNGLKLYYEIYGSGQPLILLHGGLGLGAMFGPIMQALSTGREVITVDLQAHGHTADINRPLTLEAMGDDIAALLKFLNIPKADLMGYSMGGGVALQTAIRHQEVVRKLVLVSFPYKRSGWYTEAMAQAGNMGPVSAEAMKKTPLYQSYISVAPKPDDWVTLHTKMGALLLKDYDYSADVKQLKMPVMLVIGDADIIHPASEVEFFALLGGGQRDGGWDGSGLSKSQLAILPGLTHYVIFASPALANAVIPFLDKP